MPNHEISLLLSDECDNVGYVSLPRHPGKVPGCVKKSIELRDLVGQYEGPMIVLDFAEGDVLIGIEIVG